MFQGHELNKTDQKLIIEQKKYLIKSHLRRGLELIDYGVQASLEHGEFLMSHYPFIKNHTDMHLGCLTKVKI